MPTEVQAAAAGRRSSHIPQDSHPHFPTFYKLFSNKDSRSKSSKPKSPLSQCYARFTPQSTSLQGWKRSGGAGPSLGTASPADVVVLWSRAAAPSIPHRDWLVKKALVSLHTGFTQSGQQRVNCLEHTSLDWMWEHTRSARAWEMG